MDVLITGTGSLASLFAARLAKTGTQVGMLGSWPAGLEALQKHGVTLSEADGQAVSYEVQVVSDPETLHEVPLAMVLVKSWQTQQAAVQLRHCLAADGLALTLQNGLGNRQILEAQLGARRVLQGVTTAGARMVKPGHVHASGMGKVSLQAHPRLEPLADRLQAAGFAVEIVADPASLLWGKLVINAAINPLTAILRVPNGALLELPAARRLMGEAAREAAAVAAATGIKLPYDDPVQAVEQVARQTAANHSSMLQDVLRGAPTEIDAINGAIVKAAREANLPAPVNHTLWKLVKGLVEKSETGIELD